MNARTRVREHLRRRWHRFRMHPRVRGLYSRWLSARRRVQPSSFTDADPFKIIYVDPADVELDARNLPVAWGRVVGGDWKTIPYEEKHAFKAAELRYLEGRSWSEIPYEVGETEPWDRLYRSIRDRGYRSQAELARSKSTDESWRWDCEVGVGIDRDGSFVWVGRGYHRLTIAKVLGVDAIPVQVRVRHPRWQAVRDEVRSAESAAELSERARAHLDHPDLRDVCETRTDRSSSLVRCLREGVL